MEETLNDIKEYIDFLRMTGWCVMVSCFENNFGDCLPVLLEYEIHQLPLCAYLKSNSAMRKKCIYNKRMLEKKILKGTYYSHCYAGVEEYVYPIIYENKTIMCVNISGYRGNIENSARLANLAAKRCGQKFLQLYSQLSTLVPDEKKINQIIRPLEYMVCELYRKCKNNNRTETLQKLIFRKAITFIYENYASKITCADVAEAVGYSEVHLRHIFYLECKKSILEYINDIRLSRAAEMLTATTCTITDIAFSCGFSDSNYFSTAFKKKYGIPPKTYRIKYSL